MSGPHPLAAALLALLLSRAASSQETFTTLLLKDSLSFTLPTEFAAVPVIDNPDVRYQFAMRSSAVKAEIRYSIFPASPSEQYAATWLQTIYLNLSKGKRCNIQPFPPAAVKAEFGADYGFTSLTALDSEFGRGYAYGMVNLIHKNAVADVVTFFLFDDMKVMQSLLFQDAVFHALRFK